MLRPKRATAASDELKNYPELVALKEKVEALAKNGFDFANKIVSKEYNEAATEFNAELRKVGLISLLKTTAGQFGFEIK